MAVGRKAGRNATGNRRRRQSAAPSQATIRDFSGGWNVADDDTNLANKYQPISDNILHGIDGSISPRYGYMLFADFRNGTSSVRTSVATTLHFVSGSRIVTITWTAHGLTTGMHVNFGELVAPTEIGTTYGVTVIDANTISISLYTTAGATADVAKTFASVTVDSHTLSGNIIHGVYFHTRLVVFDDVGEIGTIQGDGTVSRIWSHAIAGAALGAPPGWGATERVSTSTFKQRMIAVNGYDRDKPVVIEEDFTVSYLADASSLSNAAVPRADIAMSFARYVMMMRTDVYSDSGGDAIVKFSAQGTDATFSEEAPDPADAVDVDIAQIMTSIDPTILGSAIIRNRVLVMFYDTSVLGTVGNYDSELHVPDFNNVINEFGTISHRTVISSGNDVFACDYAGVPVLSMSTSSGDFIPERVSELIGPELQGHLARLSEQTLRTKVFAVYNTRERQYMLFAPKYDPDTITQTNPLGASEELVDHGYMRLYYPNHGMEFGDQVDISGAVGTAFGIPSASINGRREIVGVLGEDQLVVDLHLSPTDLATYTSIEGAGGTVTFTKVIGETLGYIFTYNKPLKIRRWTRYRFLPFTWGCRSQKGRMFFGVGGKVYQFGTTDSPMYADAINDYDHYYWNNFTTYSVGERVKDGAASYSVLVAHSAGGALGTFAAWRAAHPTYWEAFTGYPIGWVADTPWSDFRERDTIKLIDHIHVDAKGTDKFNVDIYADNVFKDEDTGRWVPDRSLPFQAGEDQFTTNRTKEEFNWPIPVRGKLIKLRIWGATKEKVKVTTIMLSYHKGNIRKS